MPDGPAARPTQRIMGTLGELAATPPFRETHLLREAWRGRREMLEARRDLLPQDRTHALVPGEGALHTCRSVCPASPHPTSCKWPL